MARNCPTRWRKGRDAEAAANPARRPAERQPPGHDLQDPAQATTPDEAHRSDGERDVHDREVVGHHDHGLFEDLRGPSAIEGEVDLEAQDAAQQPEQDRPVHVGLNGHVRPERQAEFFITVDEKGPDQAAGRLKRQEEAHDRHQVESRQEDGKADA